MTPQRRNPWTTVKTNRILNLEVSLTTRPELPIGRFDKSKSLGGNRMIVVVIPPRQLTSTRTT